MRLLIGALFIVMGSAAAWGFADGSNEGAEPRTTPVRFLELLSPGDSVLVLPQGDGYSLTVLTADELRSLEPTPEELKEYRELEAEKSRIPRRADRPNPQQSEEWDKQHGARFAELSEKVHLPLRKIVAVGENYVGWQHRNGHIEYWPEHQITLILQGLPRPLAEAK